MFRGAISCHSPWSTQDHRIAPAPASPPPSPPRPLRPPPSTQLPQPQSGPVAAPPSRAGISSPVNKTGMDKSPFNSPSPQDSLRLCSFTQYHWPVIAWGRAHTQARSIIRSPHPSSALHFPTTSILQQMASTYFPHRAIRYPPHLNPQDPLKDLMSLACDPASRIRTSQRWGLRGTEPWAGLRHSGCF
uniref:Uncharacterized protein n=1 Tax=Oryctolagus cuniculus TaxID=9986 RepID=A0A5F9CDC1_RABIT